MNHLGFVICHVVRKFLSCCATCQWKLTTDSLTLMRLVVDEQEEQGHWAWVEAQEQALQEQALVVVALTSDYPKYHPRCPSRKCQKPQE